MTTESKSPLQIVMAYKEMIETMTSKQLRNHIDEAMKRPAVREGLKIETLEEILLVKKKNEEEEKIAKEIHARSKATEERITKAKKKKKKKPKVVESASLMFICPKKYGWRDRKDNLKIDHKTGEKRVTPELLRCTCPGCPSIERVGQPKFKKCTYCLTVYCSRECQAKDHREGQHKAFCKASAYANQALKWTARRPDHGSDILVPMDVFLKDWDAWIATPLMQSVLKYCELDVDVLREQARQCKLPV